MRCLIARVRQWWRSRTTITVTFPPGSPIVAVSVDTWPLGVLFSDRRPTYHVHVGDRSVMVRKRLWDTRASVARKIARAIGGAS